MPRKGLYPIIFLIVAKFVNKIFLNLKIYLLLQGLRCNWSLVNQTYQGLSLLTDTLYKKQRKVKVEEQLQKLERFIQILEKHTVIYIADNPYALL